MVNTLFEETTTNGLAPLATLSTLAQKDAIEAAKTLTPHEAKFLCATYYDLQEYRKASANQVRSLVAAEEPHSAISFIKAQIGTTEGTIRHMLDAFSASRPEGRWVRLITGIGPVIAAGLIAHINIEKAPTAGHIYSLAGLDPRIEWLGTDRAAALVKQIMGSDREVTTEHLARFSQETHRSFDGIKSVCTSKEGKITKASCEAGLARRPWNAQLKTLAFNAGDCFVKFQNHPKDFYGKLYVQRKVYEQGRNQAGELADQAAAKLTSGNYRRETNAKAAYEQGRLPDAHIHMRALRWTTKLFLSHYWEACYVLHYGKEPPAPYAQAILGHAHRIALPFAPVDPNPQ